MKNSATKKPLCLAISAATLLFGLSTPLIATAQADAVEEVIVTGSFRESLAKAIDAKRNAANARESIMAEDMGKMPDLNLAESLQRVPGVAIAREAGEGRQVTIRGLGPAFTRSTLNGMEVPSSTDGLDSADGMNTSRAFDFNVFSSELFNRIDIHKSLQASVEEGGLAGTVDLYTAKPFDNPGFHVAFAGQAGYNDLTKEADPRGSFMISTTNEEETFGALLSVAYTERTVREEGAGTVRWQTPANNGRTWKAGSNPTIDGTLAAGTTINNLSVPRLPRTDYFGNTQERLGVTTAFQFRPSDNVELSLDLVHANFTNQRESHNFDSAFRNQFQNITPNHLVLDDSGTGVVAGEFSGVLGRTESRLTPSETDFNQMVFTGKWNINDRLTMTGLLGQAKSDFDSTQYRFNIQTKTRHDFGYDYRQNSNIPVMTYGYDIMDENLYEFDSLVYRKNMIERDNITGKLDFELKSDARDSNIKFGLVHNIREVNALEIRRTDVNTLLKQTPSGLTQPLPVDDFGRGLGAPSGFLKTFLVLDFDKTIDAYNFPALTNADLNPAGSTFYVEEKTLGAYVEWNVNDFSLFGKTLRTNAGLRVVETESTIQAYTGGAGNTLVPMEAKNDYVDVLPSINFAWEVTDDVLVRLGLSRNITRPDLERLSPSASFGLESGEISVGNPNLDPMRANSLDVGVEWYFNEDALLAGTVFYKDVESFIATESTERLLDPVYHQIVRDLSSNHAPLDQNWGHNEPINNDGAKVKGLELVYQQPFTFLPGAFSNMGTVINYTWVDSESNYGTGENPITSKLIGLSENSYNMTLYYETELYGARVSVNKRDDYLTRVPGREGNSVEGKTGPTNIDFSAFYNINDNLTVSLEAINVTDEKERLFGDDANRVVALSHTGRQFFVGIRGNF